MTKYFKISITNCLLKEKWLVSLLCLFYQNKCSRFYLASVQKFHKIAQVQVTKHDVVFKL